VLTGVTTEVCVHSTLREANDRGFVCLLLEDCCAATERETHDLIVRMGRKKGIFGCVARSEELLETIAAPAMTGSAHE
jgi:nicotinamidase-related amidase